MEVYLDPKEVLAHLNEMGYKNITPEQLRDFVRDLKKLIKYDVQHCKCENWHSGFCTTCSSRSSTPIERPPLSSMNGTHQPRDSVLSDQKMSTKTDRPCREYTVTAEIKTGYPKSNQLKKSDSVKFEKENKIEIVEHSKPAPSFIKPWQLQRGPLTSRSDPVSLYHKYQTYWRQQKVPGEDSRAELRWRVREKMIGQDPHPRPSGRCSPVQVVTTSGVAAEGTRGRRLKNAAPCLHGGARRKCVACTSDLCDTTASVQSILHGLLIPKEQEINF